MNIEPEMIIELIDDLKKRIEALEKKLEDVQLWIERRETLESEQREYE